MKIRIENVSKNIHGSVVLQDVNACFESGQIYGLKGRNGSGKTMLLRCISGLIFPTTGQIVVDGKTMGKDLDFPESMGILLENPAFLNGYTGFENLRLLAGLSGNIADEEICTAICRVGLDPEDRRSYRKYSLGMKQRLGIACAIMGEPDLIILDEPFNALDEEGISSVKKVLLHLRARGKLIIVACHDGEELKQMSDQIYLVDAGKVKRMD